MRLAIKGHATRGDIVIKTLEMFGGKNSNHCTGSYINRIYFINKNGYIESTDDAKLLLYYSLYSLNEFKIRYPFVINDVVSRKCHPTIKFQISQMKWDDVEECVIYVLNNQLTARVDDLQPYKEEAMEESIDKTNKVIFDTQAQSCDIMNDIIKENMEEANIIKPTTEINLNHPRFDGHNEIELIIPNGWKFEQRGNKMFGIRKQYPKTYIECAKSLECFGAAHIDGYKCELLEKLQELLICRDAYWKIAGEQMGLGKSWEPDFGNDLLKYYISFHNNKIDKGVINYSNKILAFPTEEMQDTFYENFKELINECKDFI